ncbi:MAG: hypothetical protein Ct9H300mP14_07580 [Gammaproteobacteria bacterium]|nr:MAG: hypothetical protein Ct9H300mP14_07580 [Gammaproteobacteria bacterium]
MDHVPTACPLSTPFMIRRSTEAQEFLHPEQIEFARTSTTTGFILDTGLKTARKGLINGFQPLEAFQPRPIPGHCRLPRGASIHVVEIPFIKTILRLWRG